MKNIIKKPKKTGLKDNLNYMTVDFLKNIAKVYEVDKTYKMKKQELIDVVYERLTDENYLISNLAAYYEHEEHMTSVNGNEPVADSIKMLGLAKIGMYFLYDIGDGNIESIMPKEIKKVIDDIDENKVEIVKNEYSEVFNYLRACINFYGVIDVEFFLELFAKHHEDQPELTLKKLMYYLEKYNIHNSEIVYYNGMLVCEALCMYEGDIDKILEGREGKEYYVPQKEELLKYSDEYYIKKTKYYDDLEKYLLKHLKYKKEVEEIIGEININCVMDTFNIQKTIERLHMLGVKIESMKDIEKLMTLCVEFGNNTPKWINKGWTPSDLMKKERHKIDSLTVINSNKVGRNDPCPCGSGKKYKKCCGR
ncbi:MAG: SEC-C metal-binding domain-containing protein [Clostridium sp.]